MQIILVDDIIDVNIHSKPFFIESELSGILQKVVKQRDGAEEEMKDQPMESMKDKENVDDLVEEVGVIGIEEFKSDHSNSTADLKKRKVYIYIYI